MLGLIKKFLGVLVGTATKVPVPAMEIVAAIELLKFGHDRLKDARDAKVSSAMQNFNDGCKLCETARLQNQEANKASDLSSKLDDAFHSHAQPVDSQGLD